MSGYTYTGLYKDLLGHRGIQGLGYVGRYTGEASGKDRGI